MVGSALLRALCTLLTSASRRTECYDVSGLRPKFPATRQFRISYLKAPRESRGASPRATRMRLDVRGARSPPFVPRASRRDRSNSPREISPAHRVRGFEGKRRIAVPNFLYKPHVSQDIFPQTDTALLFSPRPESALDAGQLSRISRLRETNTTLIARTMARSRNIRERWGNRAGRKREGRNVSAYFQSSVPILRSFQRLFTSATLCWPSLSLYLSESAVGAIFFLPVFLRVTFLGRMFISLRPRSSDNIIAR